MFYRPEIFSGRGWGKPIPPFCGLQNSQAERSFTIHAPKTSTMPPKKDAAKDVKPPADTKGEKGAAPDAKDAAKKGKGKK